MTYNELEVLVSRYIDDFKVTRHKTIRETDLEYRRKLIDVNRQYNNDMRRKMQSIDDNEIYNFVLSLYKTFKTASMRDKLDISCTGLYANAVYVEKGNISPSTLEEVNKMTEEYKEIMIGYKLVTKYAMRYKYIAKEIEYDEVLEAYNKKVKEELSDINYEIYNIAKRKHLERKLPHNYNPTLSDFSENIKNFLKEEYENMCKK